MIEQDFSRKITIVVDRDAEPWRVLNTVAHVSAGIGHKLGDNFGTGENFVTKDGVSHPRNSQYGIVVLQASKEELYPLLKEVRANNLLCLAFSRGMNDVIDDSELEKKYLSESDDEIELLGVGMFGDKEILKKLTSKFKLWK